MGSYSAPSHPPPPRVPDGWKPIWDDRYSEYFYVNLSTSESTWDKPTQPAYSNDNESQDRSLGGLFGRSKKNETDEEMARRLQNDERNRRNGNDNGKTPRGEAQSYYSGEPVSHGPLDQEGIHNGPGGSQGSRGSSSTGFRAKIRERMSSGSSPRQYYPPSQAPMGYGGPPPPQMYMGGPVYAPPPQPYGYGIQPQPMYMQQPMRARRQGMGPGGGAALGLGGGLLGGMMLGNAMNSGQQDAYQDGFADGADFDGGDMDGGDFGD
ncbi:hypothetical protein ES702_02873 [subsurface metagenome]